MESSVISPSGANVEDTVKMPNKNNKGNRKGKNKPQGKVSVPAFFRPGPVVQYADFAYSAAPGLTEGAVGAGALYVYSLSSIYDPDVSGVGTTALGYTSYSSFFTRYRVVRTRIEITATPYSTSTGTAMIVGYMVGPNSTVTSSSTLWPVQTNSHSKMVHAATPGGSHGMANFKTTVDLARVQGVTKQQFMTDLDYSASFGSNPARQSYLILFVRGLGGAVAVASYDVRIVYHTELSQPLQTVIN